MTNWAAGWNMGGYSPDPDHVMVTDSFETAVAYLVDTVDRWWDSDYDTGDDASTIDGRYLDAHTMLHNVGASPSEISVTVQDAGGYDYHLWVVPTSEPVDGE